MDMIYSNGLLVTPAQMRDIDQAAIRDYGIPGIVLMENAACGVTEYIAAHADELFFPERERSVLIVCGKGNNGGDGFAVARRLSMLGFGVFVLALADRGDLPRDAKTNFDICENLEIEIIHADECQLGDVLSVYAARAGLIVDAIFGTGYRGRPEGVYETAIRAINDSGKKVVSIDAPSGLDGLSGAAVGECVNADVTLALGLLKVGLYTGPDIGRAGRIELVDIGLPRQLTDNTKGGRLREKPDNAAGGHDSVGQKCAAQRQTVESEPETRLINGYSVSTMFKPRKRDAHKGNFGRLLIITGSPGMTGAGCLAAEAALTAGAGLVYLAVPGSLAHIYESSVKESITLCAGSGADKTIGGDAADVIINNAGRMDAVAIGPGMSTEQDTASAIRKIITSVKKPLIIDADALTAVAADTNILMRLAAPAVLTPHEAEMARLLGIPAESVAKDRLALARNFATKHNVTLILKGRRSIVAAPDGRAYVNTTGNPGMATAGSGDTLTGILAAFVGAGMDTTEAAVAAVYLHGLAGDLAAAALGERSVRATDIIRYLPGAFVATGVR